MKVVKGGRYCLRRIFVDGGQGDAKIGATESLNALIFFHANKMEKVRVSAAFYNG